ncbi:MAG TPA: OmpA family protein [Vicinamibacterales bacterium]|nr:OmpA family protein [Vicinamibacterales bacterium]
MRRFLSLGASLLALLAVSATAAAQAPATTAPDAPPAATETRPATTTFLGDTGLWYVPTAEILPHRKWSLSAYRVNFDDDQGFTDVSNWPVTFGIGVKDRLELFGSLVVVNRIDRDVRPLFLASASGSALEANRQAGGFVVQNPLARRAWSGNNVGDLWLGGKINLLSEWRQQPAAFALRLMVKAPTGDTESGAGTGKADFAFDAILSKELNARVELSGYAGYIVRGEPDEVEETNGFRWGAGAAFPSRRALRVTAEIDGEAYANRSLSTRMLLLGEDGSFAPANFTYEMKSPVNVNLGLTWQHRNGFFAGAGWTWRATTRSRDEFLRQFTNGAGDRMDVVGRIGYHPGARVFVAPAPPPPPPPPPPAPQNRPPTVRASCQPCTVFVGRTSTVAADAQDPDGDALTYAWSAPAGSLTTAAARQTPWTAPMVEGPVPVTVRVSDGKGGSASDVVTIQVMREAVKEVVFEDVHFDFDRYSLRPEATRALDEAVRALQENAGLRLEIEGHTCNIGTAEYNLALGERRAAAVREYLASRGIGADRLRTVSYGEERPKFDNAREETRRLNRRAALVVRIQ